jgi:fucose permease
VHGGGLLIGLTLVSFPASGAVLRNVHHLSDVQYGAIYLPQLLTAVFGALLGGVTSDRMSLSASYRLSVAAFAAAELLLFASASAPSHLALSIIMLATGCFGFGFGFGGGPLNAFAAMLFPKRSGASVTALHMCAGLGLMLGPLLFGTLAQQGRWAFAPLILVLLAFAILLAASGLRLDTASATPAAHELESRCGRTARFWLCAFAAMIYSVCEGIFSNWAVVFLSEERHLPLTAASFALTMFWGDITLGRLIATLSGGRVPPVGFLFVLPLAMIGSLLLLPGTSGVASAYLHFGLAGLSCSAFFPMLVAFTAERHPASISWIASMLTAAMMVGVGIGSYAIGALKEGSEIASLYRVFALVPLACLACIALALLSGRRAANKA